MDKPDTDYGSTTKSATEFVSTSGIETDYSDDADYIPSIVYDTALAYNTTTPYLGRSTTQKPTVDTPFGDITKPQTGYAKP